MKTTATSTRMVMPPGVAMYTMTLSGDRHGPHRLVGWFSDSAEAYVKGGMSRLHLKGYNRRGNLHTLVTGLRTGVERLAVERVRKSVMRAWKV